jgi:hypothetical protein
VQLRIQLKGTHPTKINSPLAPPRTKKNSFEGASSQSAVHLTTSTFTASPTRGSSDIRGRRRGRFMSGGDSHNCTELH